MKRILMVVAMAALAFPGYSEPFGGHGGHGQPQPGHGGNGGYHQPGPGSQPGHGPQPGNGGYGQPSQPGHGPQPGNGGYGPPSQPGHGPGGMGHPPYPGHGGGYNPAPFPGHGPGGHHDNGQAMLRESFRRIQGLFRLAETSFFPGMTRRDMMECARTLSQIEREISDVQFRLPGMASQDAGRVQRQVGQARFALMTDYNAREAHRIVRGASMDFDMIVDRLMGR